MSITFQNILKLFFLTVGILLYLLSYKNGLVFSGDSIQYLKMAYKTSLFQLPVTDKWMPLYSVFIGIFTFWGINILDAAFIVNLLLYVGVLLLTLYLINLLSTKNSYAIVGMGFLILLNRELLFNSLSIMGELPMFFFILLFFTFLFRYLKNEGKLTIIQTFVLALIVMFSVFTKYNGLVLFILLLYIAAVTNKGRYNMVMKLSIVTFVVFVPYIIWSRIKADNDIVANALASYSFFSNILINLKDLTLTFSEFLFIPKVTSFLQTNFSETSLAIVGIVILCGFLIVLLIEARKSIKGIGFILTSFVILYLISFLYLSSSTGINEVNQRTLFYPLMILLVYIIYLFTYVVNQKHKVFLSVIIIILIVFNSLKVYQTTKRFVTTGYGTLSKDFVLNKNQTLDNSLLLINEKNLVSSQIFTNQHKLLPIYLDFELMNELPTNRQWLGNKNWYKDDFTIINELMELKKKVVFEHGLIIYLGNDFLGLYNKYFKSIFDNDPNITIRFYSDGFVIN